MMQAIGNRGYTGLGEQMLDSSGRQKKGDTKESYYICSTHQPNSHISLPPSFSSPGHGLLSRYNALLVTAFS